MRKHNLVNLSIFRTFSFWWREFHTFSCHNPLDGPTRYYFFKEEFSREFHTFVQVPVIVIKWYLNKIGMANINIKIVFLYHLSYPVGYHVSLIIKYLEIWKILFFSFPFLLWSKQGLSLDFLVKVLMNNIWKAYCLSSFKMKIS